ncbi:cysteine-rich receptor-like protein kinase 29 [Rosa chinensis]|uniref:cysteine-rich receptor-like protein kinase 29 n=1 Tax=Rosa chinensis TaxID=74649 RepID=UPI000D093808|nr:cysteine-rich receptor-like protein kinase 29 [Rosa chinensis]
MEKATALLNSAYQTNLSTLISTLVSTNGNGYGFYNSSYAKNSSNEVYATGLCRRDFLEDACRSCLNESSHKFTELCPNEKKLLSFITLACYTSQTDPSMEDSPAFYLVSPRNVASLEVEGFFEELWKLIQSLNSEAAAGGSLRKFAVNNTTTSDFKTIYAQTQCTPKCQICPSKIALIA